MPGGCGTPGQLKLAEVVVLDDPAIARMGPVEQGMPPIQGDTQGARVSVGDEVTRYLRTQLRLSARIG